MARREKNDGSAWSASDLKTLNSMAKSGDGATATAAKLGRTAAAVQQKAMRLGISFRGGARKKAAAKKSK
jgi:hypothetical protein